LVHLEHVFHPGHVLPIMLRRKSPMPPDGGDRASFKHRSHGLVPHLLDNLELHHLIDQQMSCPSGSPPRRFALCGGDQCPFVCLIEDRHRDGRCCFFRLSASSKPSVTNSRRTAWTYSRGHPAPSLLARQSIPAHALSDPLSTGFGLAISSSAALPSPP
jgi:hypothetical protein